jgi:hydroxymethylpyrimidine pyrophosphatase-like HAD family hydrolase
MAMGDNLNDLQMLEFAGTAVLMENALPELKARGWAMTGTNNDAGVSQAINRYVLEDSEPRMHRSSRGPDLTERRPI